MRLAILWLAAGTLAGCGNPVNLRTAGIYHEQAEQAERAGDFVRAEQLYDRALLNARLAHAPDNVISGVQYNLGRMKGYQCKFAEAETLLAGALKLEEAVSGPDSGITTMRLFELARLNYDQERFEQAVPYYARGIVAVRKLGMETGDPIALANALDEYANALARTGRADEARSAESQAQVLRARNTGKSATFVPVRYRCPGKTA